MFIQGIKPLFSARERNDRTRHGSFLGRNGFRLSLFDLNPVRDHKVLLEIGSESEEDGPPGRHRAFPVESAVCEADVDVERPPRRRFTDDGWKLVAPDVAAVDCRGCALHSDAFCTRASLQSRFWGG